MQEEPRYLPAGEAALVIEFGAAIDPKIHDRVLALDAAIRAAHLDGVCETVPTYRSLMIHFDPRKFTHEALIDALASLRYEEAPPARRKRRWQIPACYDPVHAEDLAEAAALLGISQERIVCLHLSATYRVYMYGFAPGYVFLGGLAPELTLPRRAQPRPAALAGALLIAGGQALIAGCAMPTGWYMIGRTPAKMFDPARNPLFLMNIGDEVCFERIGSRAFDALQSKAELGEVPASAVLDEA